MLGATGDGGQFLTPLADKLIENNAYKSVVIVPSGIAGTPISHWKKGGDLNKMLIETISQLLKTYRPTHIVWHQGESDFINKASALVYAQSFQSLKKSLNDFGVNSPLFISISTQCSQLDWTATHSTSDGQKTLLKTNGIFLCANTEILLSESDRAADKCHFSESGLDKVA
ncbi:sialate O-acetylesterase [Polynucleobacter paneuropaeus]|nr:sialate O-acetylesterase [Polynucleobacter paneuropaeus]